MAVLIALQVAAFALLNLSLLDLWDVFDRPAAARKVAPGCIAGAGVSVLALCLGGVELMKIQ